MNACTANSALLWRCRRGMKELDVLLGALCRCDYGAARRPSEPACSLDCSSLPDPLLAEYLFGHASAQQPDLARLVERIARHRT